MDYNSVGLMAGIEIHQQLDTKEKLFCHCETCLREVSESSRNYFRYLRATESELGEIDRAAREEMKRERKFTYYAYDSTCLVEDDEEPPAPLNKEALSLTLTIAKVFGMTPVEQIHTMRKLVIDGSNTSGFQRTALVAVNGGLPFGGDIETICLEEEACQRIEGDTFSLDRLGIPLVEITTGPFMRTPEEVQATAAYLGMVLRSTGKVKRGLGTIRQDINISISGGSRVEIKGVQELDLISEVVRREIVRQRSLLSIRDELLKRGASVSNETMDVTSLFRDTRSEVLKKAKKILVIVLSGFGGLVGSEIQPGRRLGTELSDYAKKCGVGGIFHTDELPAYGVTGEEVTALMAHCASSPDDCLILVSGSEPEAICAAKQVIGRAGAALAGVPEETRKMLPTGNTSYMRPLPGAARMYPETDVLPVVVGKEEWERLVIPELLDAKVQRYVTEYSLDPSIARQVVFSEYFHLFTEGISEGIRPALLARTITGTMKELRREGVPVSALVSHDIISVLMAVDHGKVGKEAVPDLLREIAEGTPVDAALAKSSSGLTKEDIRVIVKKFIDERQDFIRERRMGALGPVMGLVMKEVRGAVDGKIISEVLSEELTLFLSGTETP